MQASVSQIRPLPLSEKRDASQPTRAAYGWTGVLMTVAFVVSGVWTAVLAVVQLVPTDVANYLMGTTSLDMGDFWTLQRIDDGIAIPAAVLLLVIAMGYVALAVATIRQSRAVPTTGLPPQLRAAGVHPLEHPNHHERRRGPSKRQVPSERRTNPSVRLVLPAAVNPRRFRWRQSIARALTTLNTPDVWSHQAPALALPKLLLQTSILFKYLQEGFPQTTIFVYAVLLLLNWMISSYCAIRHLVDPRSTLVRIFYSFDLFFAAFAPLQVLVYAYYNFQFDMDEFSTRIEVLNPGNFDVIARLFADPAEVSLFRAAFRSLQLSSWWSLGVKAALNAFTIRRWWRAIRLVDPSPPSPSVSRPSSRSTRLLAALFGILGGGVFVYTVVSVVSSTSVCERFVHCKVPSYRWNVGAQQCSCSVFVDRETRVKTFAEWENPIDTTANLAALAASGDLRIVQIINRQLPTLPAELRRCRGLEQLILIYTKIVTMPEWAQEFEHLEYFHIEGDLTNKQLRALPANLFLAMPKLEFLHLGCLPHVPFVPNLSGLPKLKYLTVAMLHSITTLPSFHGLAHLQRLNIIDALHVDTLPSISHLTELKSLVIMGRNAMCCNGFIGDTCDLTAFSCRDRTAQGERRVDCVGQHMSPSDQLVIHRVGQDVCDKSLEYDLSETYTTRESSDGACGGVIYKRCFRNGQTGICFPSSFSFVACELFPPYQALRRLQIQRGVGDPCDAVVEQWLGCRPHQEPSNS